MGAHRPGQHTRNREWSKEKRQWNLQKHKKEKITDVASSSAFKKVKPVDEYLKPAFLFMGHNICACKKIVQSHGSLWENGSRPWLLISLQVKWVFWVTQNLTLRPLATFGLFYCMCQKGRLSMVWLANHTSLANESVDLKSLCLSYQNTARHKSSSTFSAVY